jgi:hypothetical protein
MAPLSPSIGGRRRGFTPRPGRLAAAIAESNKRDVEAAARAIGLQIQLLNASTSREIDAAFATFVRERPDALFVGNDAFLTSRRVQLVHLATRHGIPTIYNQRDFAEVSGLMSYGVNHYGCASSGWCLCRPHPQGRQASGPAGRTVEQVRAGHQRRDCQDARPHRAAVAALSR